MNQQVLAQPRQSGNDSRKIIPEMMGQSRSGGNFQMQRSANMSSSIPRQEQMQGMPYGMSNLMAVTHHAI
jgi:hypothetical protein